MSTASTDREARNAASSSARELIDCFSALHQRMWSLLHELGSIKQQRDKLSTSPSAALQTCGSGCGSSPSPSPVAPEDLDGKWLHKFAEMRVAICAAAPLMSELEALLAASGNAQEAGFSAVQSPAIDNLSNSSLPRAPERCTSESTLMHPTSFRDATTAYTQSPRRTARMELGDETISIVAVESERVTPAEQPFAQSRSPGETALPLVTLLSSSATSSSPKGPPSVAPRSPPPAVVRDAALPASPFARAPAAPPAARSHALAAPPDSASVPTATMPIGEGQPVSGTRQSFVSLTSSSSPRALSNSISRLVMPSFWSPVVVAPTVAGEELPGAARLDTIGNGGRSRCDAVPQFPPIGAGGVRNPSWSVLQEAPGVSLSRGSHIPSATELLNRHRTSSMQR